MKDTSKKAATLRILADINAGLCEQGLDGRHGGAVFECSFTHAQARRAWAAFQALARVLARDGYIDAADIDENGRAWGFDR